MRLDRVSCAALLLSAAAAPACAQLRVGQWNITNWTTASVSTRGNAFISALFDTAPNGEKFVPDILVVQEVAGGAGGSAAAALAFLTTLNTGCACASDWAMAPYVVNQGDTGNAFYYRSSKVQWLSTTTLGVDGLDVGSGSTQSPRDNQRWRVRLVGYTSPGAELYIYTGHFKAGSTSADQIRRNPEALRVRNDANALPSNIGGFILAGDFNIQASSQLAYQYLIDFASSFPANDPRLLQAGQFFDPISRPGSWNNSCSFRNIHTQEPGANNGGMDDRHDQILISASLRDSQGLSYLPAVAGADILAPFLSVPAQCVQVATDTFWFDPNHSYRCWGNDGNHFNGAINAGGTNSQVGSIIATNLITTTDGNGHLPVYLDLQIPAKLGSITGTIDFGSVNVGAAANFNLTITNNADVTLFSKEASGAGIDPLTYSLSATTGFSAPAGPFNRSATAAPAQSNVHVISMNTATAGVKTGTLTISSDDPDVPTRIINLTGTVNSGGPPPPPPGNYDVNNDGTINNDDLTAWFGLFTDVNNDQSVDVNDINALRAYLRWFEITDITAGRR